MNKFNDILRSPEVDAAGGGGLMGATGEAPVVEPTITDPPEGQQQQAAPTSILNDEGKFSPQWYANNEDLAPHAKQLDKFNAVEGLAKSYIALEKNRVVPTKDSDPNYINSFRTANNVPQNKDGYDIEMPETMPEGVIADNDIMAEYKEVFHDINLTPHQAQVLTTNHVELMGKMAADQQGQIYEAEQKAIGDLQREWGASFGAKLESAQHSFDSLCMKAGVNSETVSFRNDPAFAKIMEAVAQSTSESRVVGAGNVATPESSGKRYANSVMTDSNHPDYKAFYDPNDPRHAQVYDKVAFNNR